MCLFNFSALSDKKNILITGANGQLGMELRALVSIFTGFEFIFVSKEDLSITDTHALNVFFDKHIISYCVNCAAYTNVDLAETESEKAFEVNATATGELAKICNAHNCRLIHFSTDYVFPGNATSPYVESENTGPINIYGASKLEGERLAIRNHDDVIIIRSSWIYSAHGKNFVKTMARLLKDKESIQVVNDQWGSPTFAGDLAYTVMQIISTDYFIPGIYHYSNAGIITWYTFAATIKKETGSKCLIHPIPTTQFPTVAKRPAYSALNTTKIKEVFGVQIRGWEDSLQKCLANILPDSWNAE